MSEPVRVQRKRTKGWKMPPNTVYVGRPTKWGNPWSVAGVRKWLAGNGVEETFTRRERAANCVYNYRIWMHGGMSSRVVLKDIGELKGKNLACFCGLDQPCHADVLLELANSPPAGTEG